jgi:predicted N-acetyltransferase YhbS
MTENTSDKLEFKLADHYTLPLVKQFFKKNGMRAQAPKGDIIYIATLNHLIVAALRLQPVQNCYLLRSMCVSRERRNTGIGSALLQFLQKELTKTCTYSFPYGHLADFYSRANFQLCDSAVVPQAIANKFKRYLVNGKQLILMMHQP